MSEAILFVQVLWERRRVLLGAVAEFLVLVGLIAVFVFAILVWNAVAH